MDNQSNSQVTTAGNSTPPPPKMIVNHGIVKLYNDYRSATGGMNSDAAYLTVAHFLNEISQSVQSMDRVVNSLEQIIGGAITTTILKLTEEPKNVG